MLRDARRRRRLWIAGIILSLTGLTGGLGIPIRAGQPAPSKERQTPTRGPGVVSTMPITPTEGPSTLHRLGLTIEQSSMGWAGQWSASPSLDPAAADRN